MTCASACGYPRRSLRARPLLLRDMGAVLGVEIGTAIWTAAFVTCRTRTWRYGWAFRNVYVSLARCRCGCRATTKGNVVVQYLANWIVPFVAGHTTRMQFPYRNIPFSTSLGRCISQAMALIVLLTTKLAKSSSARHGTRFEFTVSACFRRQKRTPNRCQW